MTNATTTYDLDEAPAIASDEERPDTALVPFSGPSFQERLARVKMLGTYKKCVELEYGEFDIRGLVYSTVEQRENVEMIDETTGEVQQEEKTIRVYHQLKLKLLDGRVMMASGKGANRFYHEDIKPLGIVGEFGDFPEGVTLRVKIQSETLKGKTADGANKKWPVFTLV